VEPSAPLDSRNDKVMEFLRFPREGADFPRLVGKSATSGGAESDLYGLTSLWRLRRRARETARREKRVQSLRLNVRRLHDDGKFIDLLIQESRQL
jgi:hypothetical protein